MPEAIDKAINGVSDMSNQSNVQQWTIDQVLNKQVIARPDQAFITIEGETVNYMQADQRSAQAANLFNQGGVVKGDHVAVMLFNSLAFCDVWLGLAKLCGVLVAINTDYMGQFLSHVLNNCQARMLVVEAEFVERLEAVRSDLPYLEVLYVVGESETTSGFEVRQFEDRFSCAVEWSHPGPAYSDTGCIMYTSGTTGPSKGVLMPHAHLYLFGLGTIEHMKLREDDTFYIVLPLFHANGLFMQLYATLIAGASAVIRKRFSARRWLPDIIQSGATITNSLGVVAAFVLKQPPSEFDRAHKLRAIGLAPTSTELVSQLRERFAIPEIYGMYGMTEVSIPLYSLPGAPKPDSCGRVWSRYYDLKIVSPDTDEELGRGETGEIVVRPKQPYGFMSGYLNMPDKTIEANRNFWFHTGDAAWMDEAGDVFFVDRIKDCIRRRGENISSFEVENVLSEYPAVSEVAVYAVSSEIVGAEDEVMAAVVIDKKTIPDIKKLWLKAKQNLPTFAVPRYIRVMDELPKTPTGKLQKHLLRKTAITDDTVDFG